MCRVQKFSKLSSVYSGIKNTKRVSNRPADQPQAKLKYSPKNFFLVDSSQEDGGCMRPEAFG